MPNNKYVSMFIESLNEDLIYEQKWFVIWK